MADVSIVDFFKASDRLTQLERANRLAFECVREVSRRLYNDMHDAMKAVSAATNGKWQLYPDKEKKYQWLSLAQKSTDGEYDVSLHVCASIREFLSEDAWIGVWVKKGKLNKATGLIEACQTIFKEETLPITDPLFPYWIRIPGWPNVSLEAEAFSVSGMQRLLEKPREIPEWIEKSCKAVLKRAG